MRVLLSCLLLCVPALAQLPSAKPVPRMQAVPLPHHITSFQLDGRELTAMHFDPQDMRPFWYPIRASRDVSLTRMGHPHDPLTHSHHNSVWVTHNSLNGLDFWGDYAKKQGRIVNVEVSREGYQEGDAFASMRMVNHWISAEDKAVQLIEIRRTEVRPLDGAKSWLLLVDMEFTPPKGKTASFGASGFGLMAVRVARSIGVHDGGGRLLNSEGLVNEKAMFRLPAKWVDYSGRITNEADGFAGMTLMNHPMNPHNPTAFHVRDDGWMGACLSLDTPVEVTEAKPLRVRYGLWVHDGMPGRLAMDDQWKAFAEMPVVDLGDKKPR
ncbi:MAG TPA: PmoA family protein [Prosthecobacter sp.]